MYYGTAFVTVENTNHEQEGNLFETLGWKPANQHEKHIAPKDQIDPARPVRAKTQFFERLKKALDQGGTDTLCVYVHGADESFEDACLDAAELEYHLKRPLVLYSWPAEPKLLDYIVDNGNSEWSQGHFMLFGRDLVAFKERHPLRVIFLAHSMGNRFLFRAIHLMYKEQLVGDLELISPDIDLDTCRHYLMGFRRVDNRTAIRLYVSNRDRMLKLSQKLFGGYARLGEHVQQNLGPTRSVEDVTVRKDADGKRKLSNEKLLEVPNKEESEDSENADVHGEMDEAVIERIDFTAVDKGLTGHSIPFQLVADMVNGIQPGGLDLIEDARDSDKNRLKIVRERSPGR